MADTGFGITITFQSGFFAEIISVEGPGFEREAIETSHAATTGGAKTFIPADLYDGGEVTVEMNFSSTEIPPIDGAPESITIGWPDGEDWTFSGFMTGFTPSAPIDDRMTASATLKVAGAVTIPPPPPPPPP